jgi:acyl-coenzyme A thioesterase PaaI-like protein
MWWKVAGIAGKRFEIDLQRPVRPGMVLTGHAEIEDIVMRPERNDAFMFIRAVVTDGTKPVLSLRLESLIHARPE